MHKRVLAVMGPVAKVSAESRTSGGHVTGATLRAWAERLENAAHRLRRIAAEKEQRPGSGYTLPNFFG